MPDLSPSDLEIMRRGIATLSPDQQGLSRADDLDIVRRLQEVTNERDRLKNELVEWVTRRSVDD